MPGWKVSKGLLGNFHGWPKHLGLPTEDYRGSPSRQRIRGAQVGPSFRATWSPGGFSQKADRVGLSEELALGSGYITRDSAESLGQLPGAYMSLVTLLTDKTVGASHYA